MQLKGMIKRKNFILLYMQQERLVSMKFVGERRLPCVGILGMMH